MTDNLARRPIPVVDPIPCMVTIRPSDGAVSVLPLLETSAGLALHESDTYRRIGQIRPVTWETPKRGTLAMVKHKGFGWYFDDVEWGLDHGREETQKAALAAPLTAGGYVEAPPNAANPGLF